MSALPPNGSRSRPDRSQFDEIVYAVVRRIPAGKVMTYGDIGRLIPSPAGVDPLAYRRIRARWVGYALSRCPEDLPWHRVVNAQGRASPRPSGSHLAQLALLQEEGTPLLDSDRVDLTAARWTPPTETLPRSLK